MSRVFMIFDKKIFSQRLQALRLNSGLSQDELGEIVGVKPNSISNMEREVRGTSIEVLCKLASHFDVPLEYLVGYDGNTPNIPIPKWLEKILPDLVNLDKPSQKALKALIKGLKG
jgi:transcriptional regulator with XRE-family HTH domain